MAATWKSYFTGHVFAASCSLLLGNFTEIMDVSNGIQNPALFSLEVFRLIACICFHIQRCPCHPAGNCSVRRAAMLDCPSYVNSSLRDDKGAAKRVKLNVSLVSDSQL